MQALRLSFFALLVVGLAGCLVGGGEGWVTGDLWLSQCSGADSLDKRDGQFDLDVGFFAGESLEDPNPSTAQQFSRLTVRLQSTSTTIETSDGLMLQFRDAAEIAARFVEGQPLAITEAGLCYGACPLATDLVRGRLYLYSRCPDSRQSLVATNRALVARPGGDGCQVPAAQDNPSCPPLSPTARASLEQLCGQGFKDRGAAELLRTTLGAGGGSCLYLCSFGKARPSGDRADLAGFSVEYGDHVSGLMSLSVVDGRSIQTGTCAEGLGRLQGMFSLDIMRGTAAQTFP